MSSENEEKSKIEEEINQLDKKIDDVSYELSGDPDDYDLEEAYQEYMNDPQQRLDNLCHTRDKKKEELLKLNIDDEIKKNNKVYEKKKKEYKKGIPISDNETSNDLLSRSSYSKIIAEYIINKKTETPFNIGIFGEWGEGKSSFLKLIEEELNNENQKENSIKNYYTHIITYNATEYSEHSKIWSCILKQLFKQFENENGIKARIKFSLRRFKKKMKKDLWKYSIMAISLIFMVIWWCIFNYQISDLSQIKKIFLYGSIGIFPIIMTFANIVIPFFKSQMKIAKPLSDIVVTNMELPNYSKDLGIRENIKDDLKDLLEAWLEKQGNSDGYKDRLVIFVDELDRCSEEGIIELLEALQLFLSVKQIVIVIAINFNSVYYALRKKMDYIYKSGVDNEDKIKFCINYLEKYISIPFYLSYNGKYDDYINNLFNKNEHKKEENIIDEMEIAISKEANSAKYDEKFVFDTEEKNIIKELLNNCNGLNHITPRAVKRIVNILIISKQMCMLINEKGNYLEKIQFNNYIKWFFFAYFNPKTAFNLQKVLNKYKYYHAINLVLANFTENEKKSLDVSEECNTKGLIEYLSEIKVNEIRMFKEISNYFIFDYRNFK